MSFFGFITGPCSEHTEDCGKYDARDGVIVALGTLGGARWHGTLEGSSNCYQLCAHAQNYVDITWQVCYHLASISHHI